MKRKIDLVDIRSNKFSLSAASPYLRSSETTIKIMRLVLLALSPSILASIIFFGINAALLYSVAIFTCVGCEFAWKKLRKQTYYNDYTGIVTGTLLAMSQPVNIPLWFPVIGSVFAIIVVKELFGGVGRNVLNPALAGRAVLRLLFVEQMSVNVLPQPFFSSNNLQVVTSATPLMALKAGETPSFQNMLESFIGLVAGKNAETSAGLLMLGGLFLILKKVITWHIPASMLATIFIIAFIIGKGNLSISFTHIIAGATMLGVFFMATDYVTSPTIPIGKVLYGVGCGISVMLIRIFSSMPEGMTFAILLMNCLVPAIDKLFVPRVYGQIRK